MIVLGIHSSGPQLAVAVARGPDPLAETILAPTRTHLERIVPIIQETLAALGMEVSDMDGFAADIGPGSFSGIRVGSATAKGMAAALGKPLVGVSSLEIVARRALGPGEKGVAVIDARRGEVYAAVCRCDEGGAMMNVGEARLLPASSVPAFVERIGNEAILCGEVSVITRSALPLGVTCREILGPSASWTARVGAFRLEAGASDELHSLKPLYVRRSDAEETKLRLKTTAAFSHLSPLPGAHS